MFAELFYKGFYKAFCILPFSRNLASPAEVSPDGLGSLILLAVSCVSLVPALLLLTVSYEIVCLASPIVHFVDSFVRFASSGAVLADSLVRIAFRRLWERPPETSKTVPGLPEA